MARCTVVETTECSNCGAVGPANDDSCAVCGITPAEAQEWSWDRLQGRPTRLAGPEDAEAAPEVSTEPVDVPEDLQPAREATRVRGVAVPIVAALLTGLIGYPLTALAVAQVRDRQVHPGPVPTSNVAGTVDAAADVGSGDGHARLAGAVTFDGPALALGCRSGPPRLAGLEVNHEEYSILLTVPDGAGAGTYEVGADADTSVAVTRLAGGSDYWTSRKAAGAAGEVTIRADQSVAARFSGLQPGIPGTAAAVDGSLEMRCA